MRNDKDFYSRYTKARYRKGITPYLDVLKKHNATDKRRILDVGCGSGQWMVAASKLNEDAELHGIDIQQIFLQITKELAEQHDLSDYSLHNLSYKDLLNEFEQNSFDVILCNSVLQYIDWKLAMEIFGKLLKKNGILLMFWNHGFGYYLEQLPKAMITFKIKKTLNLVKMFTVDEIKENYLNERDQEHFVVFDRLEKVARENNIDLKRIQNEPQLDYKDKFLWFDSVFSCKGVKL